MKVLRHATLAFVLAGCAPAVQPAAMPSPATTTTTATAPPAKPKAIDPNAVASATGGKPEAADGTVKVSFPRVDVPIQVDGWPMPAFMGLTSWAAFTPGEKPGVEAMVMGDLVAVEDEVSPMMSALLDGGVEVTALHNHFFYDKPKVYFMHIGGEGTVDRLGKGVRAALDAQKAVRQKSPQPSDHTMNVPVPVPSKIDGTKLDVVFGVKGTAKDGMYKATMGRKATASCGCSVGKAMVVSTWAAFAGTDENAVVDGDFAVTEGELQPVLKSLRASGIDVVAIHHHMTGEAPRILFLHYWGRGAAGALAASVKMALDLTAWDGGAAPK